MNVSFSHAVAISEHPIVYTAYMCLQVEMRLSAQGLGSKDAFGKSDPMAVLYERARNRWVERGRTEVKTNDHSAPTHILK